MTFCNFFITALAVLALASPVQAAQYKEWPLPNTCIFGMPVSGHAVMKGNTGLITEILKAVFLPEGYELVHADLPYRRVLSELAAGNIHCTLDLKEHPREAVAAKTVIAICELSVAYVRTQSFEDMDDLTGQKVACLHGYDIQRLLPVEIKPQTVYDLTSAILMLDRGHAKFVIDDATLLKEAIQETKIPSNAFGIAPLMSLDIVPVFSPDEKGRRLRDIYDRRMQKMIASGELQRIMSENGLSKVGIQNVLKANGH
ncbi:hypothetical protein DWB63_16060 [Pseudodesulfovibrio sp. S3]|nr:transporter substrate-binding domain-containing protein [Pseudodesulfovibrio sp. S3-i]RWU02480.1 hypothetical protein DWB63_16060 [Pseudodesulfovibrio sp. S3]